MDKRSGRLSTQTARPVAIKADIKQTIHRFEVPVAAPSHWWQDDLDLVKGIRARMIIDPADGKIPPLTPQAQRRAADRIEAKKNSGSGPADSWIDPQPVRLMHHARSAGFDDAGYLWQLVPDFADARIRGHPLRDGSRTFA
jgi:hypothetical protein